jgi:acyl carrier protein phosphodiesterase
MNHLAHALLAGADDGVVLGSLLGDFWRGAPDPSWPAAVRGGVLLHRKIDVYTDSHPDVATARTLFERPWRRYSGILLDIYFDHVLARDWPRLGRGSLDDFSASIGALLRAHESWLPAGLNRFAGYFRAHGLFAAYAQRQVIERVLAGVGSRLRHANPLAGAGPVLWARAAQLDLVFDRFYPAVTVYARRLLDGPLLANQGVANLE